MTNHRNLGYILGGTITLLAIVVIIFVYICCRRRNHIIIKNVAPTPRQVPDVIPETPTTVPRSKRHIRTPGVRTLPRQNTKHVSIDRPTPTYKSRTLGPTGKRQGVKLLPVREESVTEAAHDGDYSLEQAVRVDDDSTPTDVYAQVVKPSRKKKPCRPDDDCNLVDNAMYCTSQPALQSLKFDQQRNELRQERSNTFGAYEVVSIIPVAKNTTMSLDRRSLKKKNPFMGDIYNMSHKPDTQRVAEQQATYSLAHGLAEPRNNHEQTGEKTYSLAQGITAQKAQKSEETYSLAQNVHQQGSSDTMDDDGDKTSGFLVDNRIDVSMIERGIKPSDVYARVRKKSHN